MKKEINEMMKFSKEGKMLKINGAFTLRSTTLDDIGVALNLSTREPKSIRLTLEYVLLHDKFYLTSRNVTAETVEEVIANIRRAMIEILDDIKEGLIRQYDNGYLLGNVVE